MSEHVDENAVGYVVVSVHQVHVPDAFLSTDPCSLTLRMCFAVRIAVG